MCRRSRKCNPSPESTGSQDDRFEHHLPAAGAQALAEHGRGAAGKRGRATAIPPAAAAAGPPLKAEVLEALCDAEGGLAGAAAVGQVAGGGGLRSGAAV